MDMENNGGAVTYQNFGSRFCDSLYGVCLGAVLVVVSVFLLGWNEFNYVRNDAIIQKVLADTVQYGSCTPNPAYDGKAVQFSCPLTQLNDFAAVQFQGRIKFADEASPKGQLWGTWFSSTSKIYQWQESQQCTEEKTPTGGIKKTCNYYYGKVWSQSPIPSDNFYCISSGRTMYSPGCPGARGEPAAETPVNSGGIPSLLQSKTLPNDYVVAAGAGFKLNADLLANVYGGRPVGLDATSSSPPVGISPDKKVFFANQMAYFSTYEPTVRLTIGDVQSTFTVSNVVNGQTYISVVARQINGQAFQLAPWNTGMRGTMSVVNWASAGTKSLSEFVEEKREANSGVTMLLRFVGWLIMFGGLMLITRPISLAPEILPLVGDCLGQVIGGALCCMNFAVATSWSLVIIGVAWVLARPAVGLIILMFAAFLFAAGYFIRSKFGKREIRQPMGYPIAAFA